jgi:hypothetical protein
MARHLVASPRRISGPGSDRVREGVVSLYERLRKRFRREREIDGGGPVDVMSPS